jgi:hypothetical protein
MSEWRRWQELILTLQRTSITSISPWPISFSILIGLIAVVGSNLFDDIVSDLGPAPAHDFSPRSSVSALAH